MGPGRIIISDDKTHIFNFNKVHNINKVNTIDEKFVHYYKNLLITTQNEQYQIYKFCPQVNYIDNMINTHVRLDKMSIKNKYQDRSIRLQFY